MSELVLNRIQYLELEKIGLGAFAPVRGFMDEADVKSVVARARLADGTPFPLPILLAVGKAEADRLRGCDNVTLVHEGKEVGELSVGSVFTLDKPATARALYGTDDLAHPGVRFFFKAGDWFLGGPARLTHRIEHALSRFELTPDETRRYFQTQGWKTITGFQTRNVPHRAHEYLQRVALEVTDGLFVQPLVGQKKAGDYTPEAVIRGYQELVRGFFPPDRVLLGILTTSMRYAGPREAVFHAIIRRNYGCTHFIVGRDHAGVGNYYGKYEAHEFTRRFDGELGITIMRMHGPFHCSACETIATEQTCPHYTSDPSRITEISGSLIRSILASGMAAPAHIMRPEIVAALAGIPHFITDEDKP